MNQAQDEDQLLDEFGKFSCRNARDQAGYDSVERPGLNLPILGICLPRAYQLTELSFNTNKKETSYVQSTA